MGFLAMAVLFLTSGGIRVAPEASAPVAIVPDGAPTPEDLESDHLPYARPGATPETLVRRLRPPDLPVLGRSTPIAIPTAFIVAPDAKCAVDTVVPTRWYGWELLLLDAAAATLLIKGIEHPIAVFTGVSILVVGSPLLHAANGEPSRAMLSLFVRGLAAGAAVRLMSHDGTSGGGDLADELMAFSFMVGGAMFAVVEDLALTITHASPAWKTNNQPSPISLPGAPLQRQHTGDNGP